MGSKARPVSAGSRNAWCDYGSARPDSQFDFGQGVRDDPDLSPGDNDSVYNGPGAKPKSSTAVATTGSKKSTSFFGKIGRGIRSLWATRQTEDVKGDRELHVKTTLRELIVYIVFLVILCIITFGMTSTTMYYYTKVMSDLFLDTTWSGGGSFRTITSVEDFWKFAKGPLMKGLYWETWYNNQSVPDDQLGYIYYENKLLGVPRLRQLQVHSNSCVVHDDFKNVIRECFESYAESLENKEPFGQKNSDAWTYQSEDQLDGSSHWGLIATYSGAGYVQDLFTNKSESETKINDLFDERWIQRGTRIVFIDFTVYNANINLFCVVRLTVEFPPTGGAIPHATMRTVKLIRYVTVMDYFIMACEVIFCLFIVYYMIEEAIEIKKHKFAYFKNFWNILDIVVIVIALVCVAFNIFRMIKVNELLSDLLNKPTEYANFVFLGYGQTQFDNAIAIAVFFAWIKIFKYISFNKTMTQLSSTLGKCAKDLAGFAVMFFIIFLAFTQLGYLLFGTQVKDFSNFQNSFFTLFRIILGDFDFDQLEAANRVLGPIFFMLFVFFVFFVLINMFLAIINDTYSEVKGDMANQKNEFEMTDYFKRGYEKMISKLNFKHDKIVDIQKALHSADMNNDKQVDFDEWRQDLKTRGYADGEIEALFAKYDVDGDRVLDEEEQKRMQADLNDQKAALTKEYDELEKMNRPESAHRSTSRVSINDGSGSDSDDDDSRTKSSRSGPSQSVSYEEFTVLSRRVDRMEHSIGSIVSKIDAVLVKLELMEKAKLKRRETMGKILDSITESDGTSDEVKREQMERLVREELERWDSESSITPQPSARGPSPGSGGRGGARPRSRPGSGGQSDAGTNLFVWPQRDMKSDEEDSDSSTDFDLRIESLTVSNHHVPVVGAALTSVSDPRCPGTNNNESGHLEHKHKDNNIDSVTKSSTLTVHDTESNRRESNEINEPFKQEDKESKTINNQETKDSKNTSKPSIESKNTSKPSVESKNTSKPNVESKNTSKPNVESKNTSKPNVESKNTSKPNVESKNTSKPSVESKNTSKPSVESKNTSNPSIESKNTSKPGIANYFSESSHVTDEPFDNLVSAVDMCKSDGVTSMEIAPPQVKLEKQSLQHAVRSPTVTSQKPAHGSSPTPSETEKTVFQSGVKTKHESDLADQDQTLTAMSHEAKQPLPSSGYKCEIHSHPSPSDASVKHDAHKPLPSPKQIHPEMPLSPVIAPGYGRGTLSQPCNDTFKQHTVLSNQTTDKYISSPQLNGENDKNDKPSFKAINDPKAMSEFNVTLINFFPRKSLLSPISSECRSPQLDLDFGIYSPSNSNHNNSGEQATPPSTSNSSDCGGSRNKGHKHVTPQRYHDTVEDEPDKSLVLSDTSSIVAKETTSLPESHLNNGMRLSAKSNKKKKRAKSPPQSQPRHDIKPQEMQDASHLMSNLKTLKSGDYSNSTELAKQSDMKGGTSGDSKGKTNERIIKQNKPVRDVHQLSQEQNQKTATKGKNGPEKLTKSLLNEKQSLPDKDNASEIKGKDQNDTLNKNEENKNRIQDKHDNLEISKDLDEKKKKTAENECVDMPTVKEDSPKFVHVESDKGRTEFKDAKVNDSSRGIVNDLSQTPGNDKDRHDVRKRSRSRDRVKEGDISNKKRAGKSPVMTARGQKVSRGTLAKKFSGSNVDLTGKETDDVNTDNDNKGISDSNNAGMVPEQASLPKIKGSITDHKSIIFKYTKQIYQQRSPKKMTALKNDPAPFPNIPVGDGSLGSDTDELHRASKGDRVVSERNQVSTHSSCKTPVMEKVSTAVFV